VLTLCGSAAEVCLCFHKEAYQLHYHELVEDQHAFLEVLAVGGAQLVFDFGQLGEAGHQSKDHVALLGGGVVRAQLAAGD
jgi:hypothetical protein